PIRQRSDRLTLTRLTEAVGTAAILLETPEPISFSRDVTVQLVKHVIHHVPGPFPGVALDRGMYAALQSVRSEADRISLPAAQSVCRPGDLLIRVKHQEGKVSFLVYDAPRKEVGSVRLWGKLREVVTPAPGVRPELDALRDLKDNSLAVLRPIDGPPGGY